MDSELRTYFSSASPEEVVCRARNCLASHDFEFIVGGADHEQSLAWNVEAYDRFEWRPHVLSGQTTVDSNIECVGVSSRAPLFLAPVGGHLLAHPDGEIATARAAARAGIGYFLSTASTIRLEDIGAEVSAGGFFQLYCFPDHAITLDLVARAHNAGFRAICVTVDTPIRGWRRRDIRNGFRLPPGRHFANLMSYEKLARELDAGRLVTEIVKNDLDWSDIARLCESSPLPVLVKGILRSDDARRVMDMGAAGVYISNHGGRQLGKAVSPLKVLAEVREAIGDAPVLVDGGVREPDDVLIATALGATAACVGRPILWALAIGGEPAVRAYLDVFVERIRRTMRLLGCDSLRPLADVLSYRGNEVPRRR